MLRALTRGLAVRPKCFAAGVGHHEDVSAMMLDKVLDAWLSGHQAQRHRRGMAVAYHVHLYAGGHSSSQDVVTKALFYVTDRV